jgi:hypothetical protein
MINSNNASNDTDSASQQLNTLFELAEEYTKTNKKQAVEEITKLIQELLSIKNIKATGDLKSNLARKAALHKKINKFLKEATQENIN